MMVLPVAPVVITKHADRRLKERFGIEDLDLVRSEITDAIRRHSYVHPARNIFWVEAVDRIYPVAWARHGRPRIVVMTAMCPGR